jgi:hypothetical protein
MTRSRNRAALARLNTVTEELEALDIKTTPAQVFSRLRQEQADLLNSTLLHELYFASLGGDGRTPTETIADAIARDFGSLERWRDEFIMLADALGGDAGWTPVLDTGARGATTTFAQRGIGDVLISWENDAYLALKEFGRTNTVVVPSISILAVPPVALVGGNVDAKGTRKPSRLLIRPRLRRSSPRKSSTGPSIGRAGSAMQVSGSWSTLVPLAPNGVTARCLTPFLRLLDRGTRYIAVGAEHAAIADSATHRIGSTGCALVRKRRSRRDSPAFERALTSEEAADGRTRSPRPGERHPLFALDVDLHAHDPCPLLSFRPEPDNEGPTAMYSKVRCVFAPPPSLPRRWRHRRA